MSFHEWWMVGVAVAGVLLVGVIVLVAPPGRGVRHGALEDGMVRTTGRSVELATTPQGTVYELVEFKDARGTRVTGRPAPPSRTLTNREGKDVVVRYRPDNPRFFVTEPLR